MGMYISFTKFQLDIPGRKGGSPKLFIYFGGSNCLVCFPRIVCCFLDPVLFIGCVI